MSKKSTAVEVTALKATTCQTHHFCDSRATSCDNRKGLLRLTHESYGRAYVFCICVTALVQQQVKTIYNLEFIP